MLDAIERRNWSIRTGGRRVWENAGFASSESIPVMDTVFARGFAAHRDGRLTTRNATIEPRSTPNLATSTPCICSACCATSKASTRKRPTSCVARWTCVRRRRPAAEPRQRAEGARPHRRRHRALSQRAHAAPGFPLAQYNLGNAYTAAGRHEDAADAFEKAAAPATERRLVAWNNLGNALLGAAPFRRSRSQAFRRALATASRPRRRAQQPRHGAERARRRRRRDRAASAPRSTPSRTTSPRISISAICSMRPAGHAEAVASLERPRCACSRNSRRPSSGSGTRSRRSAVTHEALPHFERAVGLDPKYGVAWLSLGNAHLALGAHQRGDARVRSGAAPRVPMIPPRI